MFTILSYTIINKMILYTKNMAMIRHINEPFYLARFLHARETAGGRFPTLGQPWPMAMIPPYLSISISLGEIEPFGELLVGLTNWP